MRRVWGWRDGLGANGEDLGGAGRLSFLSFLSFSSVLSFLSFMESKSKRKHIEITPKSKGNLKEAMKL